MMQRDWGLVSNKDSSGSPTGSEQIVADKDNTYGTS
jgi:hypothetical protein